MNSDPVLNRYIDIAFSVDKIIGEGTLIDAYFTDYSPTNLMSNIDDIFFAIENTKNDSKLVDDTFPFFTRSFLLKQINALELQLNIYIRPDDYKNRYTECLKTFVDLDIPMPNYNLIEELHYKIDILTSQNYKGDLPGRIETWKKQNSCTAEEYLDLIKGFSKDYSQKTFKNILPIIIDSDGITFLQKVFSVEYDLVSTTQSWVAYNYYQGNYSSKIVFNRSASFHRNNVKTFISHEGFPGHYTSGLIKEYFVKQRNGHHHLGLQLLNTPSSLIEEGIADTALDLLLRVKPQTPGEQLEMLLDDLNANVYYFIAYKLFAEGIEDEEAFSLLKKLNLLVDENEAIRSFKFIRSWKYYIPTYKLGRDFVKKQFMDFKDKNVLINLLYLCPNPSIISNYAQ